VTETYLELKSYYIADINSRQIPANMFDSDIKQSAISTNTAH